MLNEFLITPDKIRKGDHIFYNEEWRTVTESGRYLGPGWNEGEDTSVPFWQIRVAIPDTRWDYNRYPIYGKQESDSYDSPEPFWPYDCTEEILFYNEEQEVLIYSDKIEQLDENLKPIRWWVAVFEIDRCYGGPEEGGWWFDAGEVKQVVPASSYEQAEEIRDALSERWPSLDNSSSVIYSGGDYRVGICKSYPEDYPQRVPHYC